MIAAKAKERQATSTGGSNPQLSANLHEAEKGRTTDELSTMSGVSARNISDFVRAELALQAEPLIAAKAKERMVAGVKAADPSANLHQGEKGKTSEELSTLSGVSARNISDFVRAELALQAEPLIAERAKERQACGQGGVLLVANLPQANEAGKTRDELS